MSRGLHTVGGLVARTPYGKELQDARWDEFSHQTRIAKGNVCEICRLGDKPTQVHHPFYDRRRKPWEYSCAEVMLLCEDCHNQIHEQLQSFRRNVFGKLTPRAFQVLNGALAVGLSKYSPEVLAHAIAEFVANPRLIERHARAWEQDPKKYESWAKTFLFQGE